jgi:hypothetical protein
MANTAFLMLYLLGRALQALFFGTLRPVEIEVRARYIQAHEYWPNALLASVPTGRVLRDRLHARICDFPRGIWNILWRHGLCPPVCKVLSLVTI